MSIEELIKACAKGGDADAWEDFVRRFHGLIAAAALRTARQWGQDSPSLVDDLVQETYLRLCMDRERLLGEFQEQHPDSFYAYLKVVTTNVVHDHFRASHSKKRGTGRTEEFIDVSTAQIPAGKTGTLEGIQRNILLTEVDGALQSGLSGSDHKRDRQIFWLYYRQGMTAQAIANMPAVSLNVKGVESLIHRLTRLVRERLAERHPNERQD
jgi:RNA polymerase sigma-70 factor (ECF subfamily)